MGLSSISNFASLNATEMKNSELSVKKVNTYPFQPNLAIDLYKKSKHMFVFISEGVLQPRDLRNSMFWVLDMQMSPYLKWDDFRA